MDQWIREKLSKCLGFQVPDAMISFICAIKDAREMDSYFETLLDYKNPEHVAFIGGLKAKMFPRGGEEPSKGTAKASGKNKPATKQNQPKPTKASQPNGASEGGTKKKTLHMNIFGHDGKKLAEGLRKGRHHCSCEATKHRLINNCLHCGRIVCEQEGSGPCLFCGTLVCTDAEQSLIESATHRGDNLRRTLMEQNRPAGWEEALATRNRLLEYDRNSEKRTTVIDDEADYFRTNSVWLSDAERQRLEALENEKRERMHSSRLTRKVTLDFAARAVREDESSLDLDQVYDECEQILGRGVISGRDGQENNDPDVHPGMCGHIPTFVDTGSNAGQSRKKGTNATGYDGIYSRVQDKEFLEMSDLRHCLSMHQPWASLLVAGIKRDEGRTWYSAHRGRLWIAATAKPVCPETVRELETFYRAHYGDEGITFPTQYPSGCLLGCVSIQDCLPQEEYRKQHPNGESDSPFVFVCTEAQELPIRFPVKGEHKIYMLDAKIHQAAVKALQRLVKQNKE